MYVGECVAAGVALAVAVLAGVGVDVGADVPVGVGVYNDLRIKSAMSVCPARMLRTMMPGRMISNPDGAVAKT